MSMKSNFKEIYMIDSNDTIQYENGRDSDYEDGFEYAKSIYLDIIEAMAYEIATNRYPKKYTHTDDVLKIIGEFVPEKYR